MKRTAVEYWLAIVLWLAVIFIFSTDAFSSERTSGLIVPVLKFCFPSLSAGQLYFWHGVIRKLGHITEYFILALFTYRGITREQSDPLAAKLRTLSFVALAAAFDEIHQRLTFFRTPSPIDVGYDCLGAVCALWLITIYETWRLRPRSVL